MISSLRYKIMAAIYRFIPVNIYKSPPQSNNDKMKCLSISERPRPLHDVTDIYIYASVYEQNQLSTGVRRLVANDGKKIAQSATSFVFECFNFAY